jgi:hypothetical protein
MTLAVLLEASSAEDVVKAANRMSNAWSASSLSDAIVVVMEGRKGKEAEGLFYALGYLLFSEKWGAGRGGGRGQNTRNEAIANPSWPVVDCSSGDLK